MKRTTLCFILICCLLVTPATVGVSSADSSISGVTIPLNDKAEQNRISDAKKILSGTSYDIKDHAALFFDSNGDNYLLLTDEDPSVASATVQGTVVTESGQSSMGLIVADAVSLDKTGKKVSMADFKENPSQYKNQLVQVEGNLRQLSYTVDAAEGQYVLQKSSSSIADTNIQIPIVASSGRAGRWVALNLSGSKYGDSRTSEIAKRTIQPGIVGVGQSSGQTRWWMTSNASINLVVLGTSSGKSLTYIGRVTPKATKVSNIQEARKHDGEVVTFTTDILGSSISTQEALLEKKRCAPSSVSNPVTGCLPVPTDAVVHSGIALSGVPDDSSKVMYYTGISNSVQQKTVKPEAGRYTVTGRIVSASQIDPRLSGKAVVIYDRERVGDLRLSSEARETGKQKAEQFIKKIRQQQVSSSEEWKEMKHTSSSTKQTDKSTAKQPTPKPSPSIEVVEARFKENPIRDNEGTLLVTLRNTGGEGHTDLRLKVSDNHRQVRVHVGAGQTVTKEIPITVDTGIESSSSLSESVAVKVNGERVGMLKQVIRTDTEEPEQNDPSNNSGPALGISVLGAIFIISGSIVSVADLTTGLLNMDFAVSERNKNLTWAIGVILFTVAGLVYTDTRGLVAFIGGASAFVYGWYWSIANLIR